MYDLSISAITPFNPTLDTATIRQVLSTEQLTDTQKAQFLRNNKTQIQDLMQDKITSSEFVNMIENRPLVRFRPLKNSYTKRVDKALLANALNIETTQVEGFIQSVTDKFIANGKDGLKLSDVNEKVKTYVYRHGTKEQVNAVLGYELLNSDKIINTVQSTMTYSNGGLADYFSRPIHRMSNKNFAAIFNTINLYLKKSCEAGKISTEEMNETIDWALIRLYEIQ